MYREGDIIMREGSDLYYEVMSVATDNRGQLAVILLNRPNSSDILIDQNEVTAHWGRADGV